MENLPNCPECSAEYTYESGFMFVCPSCGHEWAQQASSSSESSGPKVYKDAHGNILEEGDTISLIKDLRIGSSSDVLKQGTKAKNIHLIEADNGHDIECKIPGFGHMQLKSEYVKKVKE